jgi:hypothetical protein
MSDVTRTVGHNDVGTVNDGIERLWVLRGLAPRIPPGDEEEEKVY